MRKFWKESINDKSYLISILLIIGMFAFGLLMSGTFKMGKKIPYNEASIGIYTACTQTSFLLLPFLICSNINKNYKEKTSLFYKTIGVSSTNYFFKKLLVSFMQIIITYSILFLFVSIYFNEFHNLLYMLIISYFVIFNVICISSIFALIIPNLIVSIGSTMLFWIFTVVSAQTIFSNFSFISIFDQQQHIFKELEKNKGYLNWSSIQEIIIYMCILLFISILITIVYKKRWIKNGI